MAEAQLAAKNQMLERCQKTIEELQMKLAAYEVYDSHGDIRTHKDTHGHTRTHTRSERAGEGGQEREGDIERDRTRTRKKGIRIYMCTNTFSLSLSLTCTQGELKKFAGIRRDIEDGILSPEKLDAAKKEVCECAVVKWVVIAKRSKTKIRECVGVLVILHVHIDTPRVRMYMNTHTCAYTYTYTCIIHTHTFTGRGAQERGGNHERPQHNYGQGTQEHA